MSSSGTSSASKSGTGGNRDFFFASVSITVEAGKISVTNHTPGLKYHSSCIELGFVGSDLISKNKAKNLTVS